MSQILRNTPATLELLVYQDGDLADLDANPTLAVTDANGTVVTTGAVTQPGSTTGTYQAVLTGQADLNRLTAVWTGILATEAVSFTQIYEIVGNLLFTESAARASTISGAQTPLSDGTLYTDQMIQRMRGLIADQFEQRTGRAWTRRYCRVEIAGTGTHRLDLWDGHARTMAGDETGGEGRYYAIAKLITVTVGGVTQTVTDLVIDGTCILHKTGSFTAGSTSDPLNVVVEYEYGPNPVPAEANEHAIVMAVTNLVASDVSAFAQSFTGQDGTVSFELAYPAKVYEWLKWVRPVLAR